MKVALSESLLGLEQQVILPLRALQGGSGLLGRARQLRDPDAQAQNECVHPFTSKAFGFWFIFLVAFLSGSGVFCFQRAGL